MHFSASGVFVIIFKKIQKRKIKSLSLCSQDAIIYDATAAYSKKPGEEGLGFKDLLFIKLVLEFRFLKKKVVWGFGHYIT